MVCLRLEPVTANWKTNLLNYGRTPSLKSILGDTNYLFGLFVSTMSFISGQSSVDQDTSSVTRWLDYFSKFDH